jgi:hypothetical protein
MRSRYNICDDTDKSPLDWIKIDSCKLIDQVIKEKNTKIYLCGNENLIKDFFSKIDDLKVTHLAIKTNIFPLNYQGNLIKLIKSGLTYLSINARTVCNPNVLFEHLNFYSKLQVLEIFAAKCSFSNIQGRDLTSNKLYADWNNQRMQTKCEKIIELNVKMEDFLTRELPNIKHKLDSLNINCEHDCTNLIINEQIQFALKLSPKRDYYNSLAKFNDDLYNCYTFKIIIQLINAWDIIKIIREDNLEKFNKATLLLSSFDVNAMFSINGEYTERLIDVALQNKAYKIAEQLVVLKAELTCCHSHSILPSLPGPWTHISANRLEKFPFWQVISSTNDSLKDIFFNNEEVLYDALAWLIYANEKREFKNIINKMLNNAASKDVIYIYMTKPIPSGLFYNFTLAQLIIYYQRNELLQEYLKHFSEEKLIFISNQVYPLQESFEFSGWTTLEVVIYRGQYEELTILLEQITYLDNIKLSSSKSNNLIELLLHGACKINIPSTLSFEGTTNEFNRYREVFNYLLKKYNDFKLDEIILKNDEDEVELPILHFVIYHNIFDVITSHLDLFENNLQQKIYINEFDEELNPLELAVFKWDDMGYEEEICNLVELYKTHSLLDSLNVRLFKSCNATLFQQSILLGHISLFRKFLELDNCPINAPFSEKHPYYPGWLPLHIIISQSFIFQDMNMFLEQILEHCDLLITTRFPHTGIASHLSGYYPSSAIFFPGNPYKDEYGECSIRKIASAIYKLLPLIAKLQGKVKQNILDEALYFSVALHSRKNSYDYSEYIKELINQGANPYQTIANTGDRIIDLAKTRGLLPLFPTRLKNDVQLLQPQQQLIKSGNQRLSELGKFTNNALYVNEDYYSVVSLVRDTKSRNSEHVFIIIEQIINGLSVMHFIDFVQDRGNPGKGKVRHFQSNAKITDSLLFSCKLELMEIKNIDDLICTQQWQLTNIACNTLLSNIEEDENKKEKIKYAAVGNQSIFVSSSAQKGHNCYTWAREKILATEDPSVKDSLKPPSLGEWLATVPSFKDTPWYQNKYILLSATAVVAATAGFYLYKNSKTDLFTSSKLKF